MCEIKKRGKTVDEGYLIDGMCPDDVKKSVRNNKAMRLRLSAMGNDALFTAITSDEFSYRDIVSALIELRDGYIKGEFLNEEEEATEDVL